MIRFCAGNDFSDIKVLTPNAANVVGMEKGVAVFPGTAADIDEFAGHIFEIGQLRRHPVGHAAFAKPGPGVFVVDGESYATSGPE